MKIYRAYSLLEGKAFDDEERVIEGMATTPTTDRVGDIVEPLGMKYALPMPLLLYHDSKMPVGSVEFAKATKAGIPFRARLPKVTEPGTVKDRVDEAWHSLKYKLIGAVSIGFKALEDGIELLKDGGLRFTSTEWLELSLVTVPANAEATITNIKTIDHEALAASGEKRGKVVKTAGVTAPQSKGTKMKPSEQVQALEAKRQATVARMEALMEKSAEEGTTLDETEAEEYDGLAAEVASIDTHLKRARQLEAIQVSSAKAIRTVATMEEASEQRGGYKSVRVEQQLPPGIEFARYAIAICTAKGNLPQALEIAKARYPDNPRIHNVLKANVSAGTTSHTTWASPLAQVDARFIGDFVDYLRPQTIIGKFGNNGIPGLRAVPANVSVAGQTSGGTGYWVGEANPKPLTSFAFERTTVPFYKVAAISVVTEELLRYSSPSAEALVRDGLAGALIERLDIDFINPAKTIAAAVSPASVLQGVAAVTSSGTDADAVRTDIAAIFAKFTAANIPLDDCVWITTPAVATNLSLMMNGLGQPEFPTVTITGGRLQGLPMIISNNVTGVATGSPLTSHPILALVSAGNIWLADDGGISVDVSREASLEMLTNPTNSPYNAAGSPIGVPVATSMVSMFQTNSVALRAEREISWLKRRSAAAQLITGVLYNPTIS